ncbi:14459_t:CDS:2, partial [Racocetra persica]
HELQTALSLVKNREFIHYKCAAHILNIAIKHSMQLETTIIKKVRDFVEYLKLKLDIDTHWN